MPGWILAAVLPVALKMNPLLEAKGRAGRGEPELFGMLGSCFSTGRSKRAFRSSTVITWPLLKTASVPSAKKACREARCSELFEDEVDEQEFREGCQLACPARARGALTLCNSSSFVFMGSCTKFISVLRKYAMGKRPNVNQRSSRAWDIVFLRQGLEEDDVSLMPAVHREEPRGASMPLWSTR